MPGSPTQWQEIRSAAEGPGAPVQAVSPGSRLTIKAAKGIGRIQASRVCADIHASTSTDSKDVGVFGRMDCYAAGSDQGFYGSLTAKGLGPNPGFLDDAMIVYGPQAADITINGDITDNITVRSGTGKITIAGRVLGGRKIEALTAGLGEIKGLFGSISGNEPAVSCPGALATGGAVTYATIKSAGPIQSIESTSGRVPSYLKINAAGQRISSVKLPGSLVGSITADSVGLLDINDNIWEGNFNGVYTTSTVNIARSLPGDRIIIGGGVSTNSKLYIGDTTPVPGAVPLGGQIILNRLNDTSCALGMWPAANIYVNGSPITQPGGSLPPVKGQYTASSNVYGGGAVGLAPFQLYEEDSYPTTASSAAPGFVPGVVDFRTFNTGATPVRVRHYGPVVYIPSVDSPGPLIVERRLSGNWTSVQGTLDQTISGREVRLTLAGGVFIGDTCGHYRVRPSGDLRCVDVDGNPVVAGYPADGYRFDIANPPSPCNNRADLTDASGSGPPNGSLSASDVVAFFGAFFEMNYCLADITDASGTGEPDGGLSGSDVVVFFADFFAGCGSSSMLASGTTSMQTATMAGDDSVGGDVTDRVRMVLMALGSMTTNRQIQSDIQSLLKQETLSPVDAAAIIGRVMAGQ